MNRLRFLVVDDEPQWRSIITNILHGLDEFVDIDTASTYSEAVNFIGRNKYDLATIDRSLLVNNTSQPSLKPNDRGLDLIKELRKSKQNEHTALLLVTAHPENDLVREYIFDYLVFGFIDKNPLDETKLIKSVRSAILNARSRRLKQLTNRQVKLQISFGHNNWIGSEIRGPERHHPSQGPFRTDFPSSQKFEPFVRRTDFLDFLLRNSIGSWREEAKTLGDEIYNALLGDREISDHLSAAFALNDLANPLLLQFAGPAFGLGLPFELLRKGNEYLCFHHVLTRKLAQEGMSPTKNTKPFYRFLLNIAEKKPLCALVVGANGNGELPMVEEEALLVAKQIKIEAARLGLAPEIRILIGPDATFSEVTKALGNGGFHLFHYAGHGRFNSTLPEVSGLVLTDGKSDRVLTAANLNMLVQRDPPQFAFLSCCLGARTAQQTSRGDFQGVLEALARADVPTVLGYRWSVSDESALEMAAAFYRFLWTILSPGHALLEARRSISFDFGRDDDTWASPVLLCQTD